LEGLPDDELPTEHDEEEYLKRLLARIRECPLADLPIDSEDFRQLQRWFQRLLLLEVRFKAKLETVMQRCLCCGGVVILWFDGSYYLLDDPVNFCIGEHDRMQPLEATNTSRCGCNTICVHNQCSVNPKMVVPQRLWIDKSTMTAVGGDDDSDAGLDKISVVSMELTMEYVNGLVQGGGDAETLLNGAIAARLEELGIPEQLEKATKGGFGERKAELARLLRAKRRGTRRQAKEAKPPPPALRPLPKRK
jgi:hypothetical protein